MQIHHIGSIIPDIQAALSLHIALGYTQKTEVIYDSLREISVVFLENNGVLLELVCPSEISKFKGILKKTGGGPYHICYMTQSYDEEIGHLRKMKFVPLVPTQPGIAFNNARLYFMWHKDAGIIEIYDTADNGHLF